MHLHCGGATSAPPAPKDPGGAAPPAAGARRGAILPSGQAGPERLHEGVHPTIEIAGLSLPSYGLLCAIGVWSAYGLAHFLDKRAGDGAGVATSGLLVAIVSAALGSKLLQLVVEWDVVRRNPGNFFRYAGIYYGGLLGALLGTFLYARFKKLSPLKLLDLVVPPLVVGHVFGRLACFAAGCCFGRPTDGPFGVMFPKASVAFRELRAGHGDLIDGDHTVALLPTQLIEACGEAVIASVLVWLALKRPREGAVVFTYVMIYASMRFVLEFFRFDPSRGTALGGIVSTSQLIAIVTVLAGVSLLVFNRRRAVSAP